MKKLITALITAAMILTMVMPAFASDDGVPAAAVKPGKVQELKVLKNGYKSLKVTWKAVDGAERYQVYRSKTGKSGSFALKKTTTNTTYTNTGITCGKTYYYKVRAVNSKGKGAFSVVKSSRVQPATVTGITVPLGGADSKPYDHKPKPTWHKVAGATGYEVYRTIEGKNKWTRIATTSKTSFLDSVKTDFSIYRNYEYKVRAYRTVNKKKVYGYFSKTDKYVPDWTMKELMPELIAYGESIKGQRFLYTGTPGEFVPYTGPEGSTYTMKHNVGWDTATGEIIYTNPTYGNTVVPNTPTYEETTPENSSWTALFPERIGHYWKRATVVKKAKGMIKFAIESEMKANPLTFEPADQYGDAGWTGTELFTIYTRKNGNEYQFWVMH